MTTGRNLKRVPGDLLPPEVPARSSRQRTTPYPSDPRESRHSIRFRAKGGRAQYRSRPLQARPVVCGDADRSVQGEPPGVIPAEHLAERVLLEEPPRINGDGDRERAEMAAGEIEFVRVGTSVAGAREPAGDGQVAASPGDGHSVDAAAKGR